MNYYVPTLTTKLVGLAVLLVALTTDLNNGLTIPRDVPSNDTSAQFAPPQKQPLLSKTSDDTKPTMKSPNNVSSNEDIKAETIEFTSDGSTLIKTTTTRESSSPRTTIPVPPHVSLETTTTKESPRNPIQVPPHVSVETTTTKESPRTPIQVPPHVSLETTTTTTTKESSRTPIQIPSHTSIDFTTKESPRTPVDWTMPPQETLTTTTAFPVATPGDNSGMKEGECPSILGNLDMLTQNQFSSILTHDCRYDKLTKPFTHGPLNVTLQLDIGHIEAVEQLQFKMHMLIQYRYVDHRLNYQKISAQRGIMVGEDLLRGKIWIPHIILSNERDTTIMGLEGKDVFVSISPQGEVIYSYRMTAQIYCWMDLKKFPFDEQVCDIHFKSWTYNASDLLLQWDDTEPVKVASQLHLTEFSLTDHWSYSTVNAAPLAKGAFVGNYSVLIFKFKLSREVGYYIMDYFVPSIMLVITSWVTFWLQADNTAPRVTLGTSTMLSFITLASVQSKNLPKVSYIKASEIWFLGCTMFIFASMTEFAFVNIIWRRTKKVELKKVNSKYILKSTLTPRLARKELLRSSSMKNLHKSHSCSSLDNSGCNKNPSNGPSYNNYLTVHSFANIPTITTQSEEDLISQNKQGDTIIDIPPTHQTNDENQNLMAQKWTTMTPQEIANWIDKRARIVFPMAFLVFNILYWTFVYSL